MSKLDARKVQQALKDLVATNRYFLAGLDALMKEPESYERGCRIARLRNWLNVRVDSAEHFGLGASFKKIADYSKDEKRMASAAMVNAEQHAEITAQVKAFDE